MHYGGVFIMQTKVCRLCGNEYPATKEYFYTREQNKDGFRSECKTCTRTKPKKEKIQEGFRKCTKCNTILPETEENFRIKKHMDGYIFYSVCRKCEKIYKKEYRVENKDKISSYNKQWYYNNVNVVRKLYKKYYLSNKEYENHRTKNYYKNNKESILKLVKINNHKRRAKLNGLYANYSKSEWEECKKHFDYKCAYCDKKERLSQDHFISLNKGGEYTVNNIIPACKTCNSSKRDSDFFEWYPQQPFYSKTKEKEILKYLNYKGDVQQLKIL
jgi:5-methylcytosine-specific restriction endonuclease McrA